MKTLRIFMIFVFVFMTQLMANDVTYFNGAGSVQFNGKPGHSDPYYNDSFSAQSISLWFNASNLSSSSRQMLMEIGGQGNGMNLYLVNGVLYGGIWCEDDNFYGQWCSTNIANADTWYHVVLTYGSKTLKLYLDGVLKDQVDISTTNPGFDGEVNSHNGHAGLGGVVQTTRAPADGVADSENDGETDSPLYFSGIMDEIVVFASELVQSDVIQLKDIDRNAPVLPELGSDPNQDGDPYDFPYAYYPSEISPVGTYTRQYINHANSGSGYDGDPASGVTTQSDQSLPVELSAFTAEQSNGVITLKWTTECEINNAGFNLYRSENADYDYQKINNELIEGAINSSTQNMYEYLDREVKSGVKYFYKLEDVALNGENEWHGPVTLTLEKNITIADDFKLGNCYPNPFNPSTTINFEVSTTATIEVTIFSINGKRIRELINDEYSPGKYLISWDGTDVQNHPVSAGVYICRMTNSQGFHSSAKLLLIK